MEVIMEMTCQDARPLVDAYLDGELSEARAGLLRKHLLDCHPCRTGAQDGRNLKRWFAAARAQEDVLTSRAASSGVPSGFAARVARRAFAGDVGQSAGSFASASVSAEDSEPVVAGPRREGSIFSFVLTATAIAAGVALMLAVGLRLQGRSTGSTMSADDRAPVPVRQVVEELERLNAAEPVAEQEAGSGVANDPQTTGGDAGATEPTDLKAKR